jgi:hypothetical protein
MRVKLALTAKRMTRFGVLVLLVASLAAAQTRTRVISWQPHTFGRLTKAGEGLSLSPVAEAVEIVGFAVGGSPVTLGEPFAAGDGWLEGLGVRLRNISGQTIGRVQMTFVLPESRRGEEAAIGFTLRYGGARSHIVKPIQPGEEFELSLAGEDYEKLQARIAERKEAAIINRVFITVTSVRFADGTTWGSGCIRATDPKNSCPASAA